SMRRVVLHGTLGTASHTVWPVEGCGKSGAGGGNRTHGLGIMRPSLYHCATPAKSSPLSYEDLFNSVKFFPASRCVAPPTSQKCHRALVGYSTTVLLYSAFPASILISLG